MKNKMEFSKKIFYIIISLFTATVIYSMVLMWNTGDTSPLAYLIPSITGLTTTSVGFYYWKAKIENVIKLSKDKALTKAELEKLIEEMDKVEQEVENLG